jgi:hypothetical protein
MGRFVEGADRSQLTLLPECLDDWVGEDNAVHVIDAFVEALDLHGMGFERVIAKETGRPSYHLSLSQIKSEHSDDVIRREFGSRGCFQWLEWPAAPAHPWRRFPLYPSGPSRFLDRRRVEAPRRDMHLPRRSRPGASTSSASGWPER